MLRAADPTCTNAGLKAIKRASENAIRLAWDITNHLTWDDHSEENSYRLTVEILTL
jgi:hypothetical protein